jgi:hypothetical protein
VQDIISKAQEAGIDPAGERRAALWGRPARRASGRRASAGPALQRSAALPRSSCACACSAPSFPTAAEAAVPGGADRTMVMQLWHETSKIKVGRAGGLGGRSHRMALVGGSLCSSFTPLPSHRLLPSLPAPTRQAKAVKQYIVDLVDSFLQGDEKFIVFAYHRREQGLGV